MKNKVLSIFAILLISYSSNYYFQIHVRTRVHIVNKCVTKQTVRDELDKLNTSYFKNTNIIVMLDTIIYINNSAYNILKTGDFTCSTMESSIFQYSDYQSLNIYVVPNIDKKGVRGFSQSIPGKNCVIEKDYFSGSTIPHEIAHCFGLFHTSDQCSNGRESITRDIQDPCYNADEAGDLVADTYPYTYGSDDDPYDPCNNEYPTSANPQNIMNQGGGTRNVFTNGQINRMRDILSNQISSITYDPIKEVLAKNSFIGTGKMIIDNNYSNPVSIPESGKLFNTWHHSSYPHFFEAIDRQLPTGNNFRQVFQKWVISEQTKYEKKVKVNSPPSFVTEIYTAKFANEYNITFENHHPGGEVGGPIKVNGVDYSSPLSTHTIGDEKITGKALNHSIDDIWFNFEYWNEQGGTNFEHEFTQINHKNYIAYFQGTPTNNYRNLRFNNKIVGQPIIVYWDRHPSNKVTHYKVYRKTKYGAEVCVKTVNQTSASSYSYTDPDYIHTNNTSTTNLLMYDVRAYYQPSEKYSEPDFKSLYGEIDGPKTQEISMDGKKEVESYEYSISNHPNPYNPTTTINYSIKEQGNVNIVVYDALGRKVKELVDEVKQPGSYKVSFDGSNLSSGIYFYTMRVNNYTASKKMILAK